MTDSSTARLSGRYPMNMDAKGRLSLPAALRDQLGQSLEEPLVVTNGDQCLEVYPKAEWDRLVAKIEAMPDKNPKVRDMKIFYFSAAQPVTLDKAGRILIPPSLRDEAGLTREVVVIGMGRNIEIYSAATWQQVFSRARQNFRSYASDLSEDLN